MIVENVVHTKWNLSTSIKNEVVLFAEKLVVIILNELSQYQTEKYTKQVAIVGTSPSQRPPQDQDQTSAGPGLSQEHLWKQT